MRLVRIFGFICCYVGCFQSGAIAGTTATSKIQRIYISAGGLAIVMLNSPPQLPIICSNGSFVVNTSTNGGRLIYRALIVAKGSNSSVSLTGDGTCLAGSKSENLLSVSVN